MGNQLRIAVIWSRFGPYHLARLRAAAEMGQLRGIELFGVEVAGGDRDYEWAKAEGADGFQRVTVFPEENYHDKSPREIKECVTRTLDRINPAVVAANGWSVAEARAGLSWCRRRKRRCVVMSATKVNDRPRAAWRELVKRFIVGRFDSALVGGPAQADYLVKLGLSRDRIHLGYDVIDNEFFAKSAALARSGRETLLTQLALPNQFFFACTRFLPRKNLDGLLEAYALYRAKAPRPVWGLVIAGSGEEELRLRALERKLDLQDVVWPGFLQYADLPVYFGLADAFVHPAKLEAWGLVLNEAAASGTPLLVSRTVGAASELVRDGESGFLFDPTDKADIAAALLKIATKTQDQRNAIGSTAQRIASEWGPERFGAGLLAAAGL